MTISPQPICAISTPPGIGGIAVVRISGDNAIPVVNKVWKGKDISSWKTHTAHLGMIVDPETGIPLDQAVGTLFLGPDSYTGQDTIELSVHGSKFVQRELITLLLKVGARLAEPGEFTRLAFSSGKIDLAEAEAVADLIAANSRAAHRVALSQMKGHYSQTLNTLREKLIDLSALIELELDFSEEEVEFANRDTLLSTAREIHSQVSRLYQSFSSGSVIKQGLPVAIIGNTNAGKSSLLNALLNDDRAIVSDIHGTTRDTIEETLEIGDHLFRLIDTAGLRNTGDTIEQIGITRSLKAVSKASIVLFIIDPFQPVATNIEAITSTLSALNPENPTHIVILINKSDLPGYEDAEKNILDNLAPHLASINPSPSIIEISAATRHNLPKLLQTLQEIADDITGGIADSATIVTNARHAQALLDAAQSSARTIDALTQNLSGELIAQHLRETIHHLSQITGQITSPQILSTIFSRFCIGK
ncbi:MAG: tRNA uridine-5-carboxymethylaminomethyl(34) synthesis GTPase MnmE [Paramuribaculum sp.]|nr:tRNA uridine-5-carboxymethylaminomethyl(34) synthesis GTPase MnmE [Paramuribaculum sp.]